MPYSVQRLFEITGMLDVLPFRDEDEDDDAGGSD